ncbi:hypothetical protein N2152v2_011267 [Parachlorella kessleri]
MRSAAPGAPPFCGPACSTVYTGTLDGLRKIARTEGLAVLWRGTDVALMMAIPMVGIYLPLYDYLVAELQQRQVGVTAPLWAGTLARTAAVFCTAPLELVRTRLQAAHLLTDGSAVAAGRSPVSAARSLLQQLPSAASGAGSAAANGSSRLRQVGSLWTGVGATLARDVPFSALYWGMVEPIRQGLWATRSHDAGKATELEVLAVNVTAGGVAGGLAGAITCPFDVVKTRAQLQVGDRHPILHTVQQIARREGMRGLFQGWSARSAKAAPACAIVLSAYEMIKHVYG